MAAGTKSRAVSAKGVEEFRPYITRVLPVTAELVCADNTGAKVLRIAMVNRYKGRHSRMPSAAVGDFVTVTVKKGPAELRKQIFGAVIVRQKYPIRKVAKDSQLGGNDSLGEIMTDINPKLIHVSKHQRDKMLGAPLADELREQYKKRTLRVIKGDSVMVVRGEYKGRGGKVEDVDTERGTLHIEGMQREKIRGGQVKVPIHTSNVKITGLYLEDKIRSNSLQDGGKPLAEKKQKQDGEKTKKEEKEVSE
jgi:ribosomal protein uL24